EMTDEEWNNESARSLGIFLSGKLEEQAERGEPVTDQDFLLLMNAHHESIPFLLPAPPTGVGWVGLVDTSSPASDSPARLFEGGIHATAGSRYQFEINGQTKVPDPASRFQPSDVHGPSEVIDPAAFDWQDEHWRGRPWEEAVIYELHIGTFTPDGTFAAAEQRLDYLADVGITTVELMPIADFAGARNWGYD